MQELLQFVQAVGVPAAIAIIVLLKVDKSIDRLEKAINKQTLVLYGILKKGDNAGACADLEKLIAEQEQTVNAA